jgi:putative heme-binding domain-containing protein
MTSFARASLTALSLSVCVCILLATKSSAQDKDQRPRAQRPAPAPRPKQTEVGPVINENKATPVNRIKVPKDFRCELLYSVPGGEQGSWVNLCLDNQGRILASDQYGGLFRFHAPPAGEQLKPNHVEKLPIEVRAVNGMVWAFDALYLGVNDYESKMQSGLYRVSDSNGDDTLDKIELLRSFDAKGDHGLHAVVPTPDGQGLFLVCGNGTKQTQSEPTSPVPSLWGEDHLLPRMPDGKGFMRDVMAPGGIIYKVSPDGKKFEIYSSGYRNIFDASVNLDGELFTYDADMEYDFNTSWYRPTRVNHVVSGSEYGWRNGAGKRPEFYADNLPATVNIGPGSPTGTTFGYRAKFPEKYQRALFVLDWSWGKMWAIHLKPDGSSYVGTKEEFVSGSPLPLTDAIIHPKDGAMYFAIGGRRVQSGLYRVTYVGSESTAAIKSSVSGSNAKELEQSATSAQARIIRKSLEGMHGVRNPQVVPTAWPHLSSQDRFIRWAARTAIEHQPLESWLEKALAEPKETARIEAVMAAARVGGVCPSHRTPSTPPVNESLGQRLLLSLEGIDITKLSSVQKLAFVRTVQIVFNRFGMPTKPVVQKWTAKLDAELPSKSFELNWLVLETLVYLQSPTAAEKGVAMLQGAPSQEEQIEYARSLRMLTEGWTEKTRTEFLEWMNRAASLRGGASFDRFMEFIRNDAINTFSETEKQSLKALIEAKSVRKSAIENAGALFAGRTENNYTMEQLLTIAEKGLQPNGSLQDGIQKRDLKNGRKMFGAAACYTCHRFGNEGGMTGPDLTSAGRRYSVKDLLEQIVYPSKEINEQFVPVEVVTEDDERFRGVIVNLSGDTITINTDAADPGQRKSIDRKAVVSIGTSKVSPMPANLLAPMTEAEILDLMAYILNGGVTE